MNSTVNNLDIQDETFDPGESSDGIYVLFGILGYLLVVLVFVIWCLHRRKDKNSNCCNFCQQPGSLCQGNCDCLQCLNCEVTMPSLTDCCPDSNKCCESITCCETNDQNQCSTFMEGCCDCGPNEEEIIQNRLQNDPDFMIRILRDNPQFQQSFRQKEAASQLSNSGIRNASFTASTDRFQSTFNTSTIQSQPRSLFSNQSSA